MSRLTYLLAGTIGTVLVAIFLLVTVGNGGDLLTNFVFGLDILILGIFATLCAQEINQGDWVEQLNQPTSTASGSRVNASQMAQGRYPWE